MEIEIWINEVMQSLDSAQRANSNTSFEKINAEIYFQKNRWKWAVVAAMLVGINVSALWLIYNPKNEHPKMAAYENLKTELGLTNSYNY